MGTMTGERTVEIAAPREHCYAIAADLERAPDWQATLVGVEVLERDGGGRAVLVETLNDAKIKTIRARLRFVYEPVELITCTLEHGDLKAMRGRWSFADLGRGRTRASYALEVDPGRMLGLLLRGPAEDRVRDLLLGSAADGLKARAEAG